MDVQRLVSEIDSELRGRGTPARAEHEKAYLKSTRGHYGTSVPAIRSIAKAVGLQHPAIEHDDLVATVRALWSMPVHEDRMAAVELLEVYAERLEPADMALVEQMLRESGTWALVDWLLPRAGRASGVTIREAVKPLSDQQRAAILCQTAP